MSSSSASGSAEWARAGSRSSKGRAAFRGAGGGRGLHAAHPALGRDGRPLDVVHRDVTPDNVLLSRAGAVYLGDFGVARAAGSAEIELRDAGPKGKRGYMAPEQARGGKVGPHADIFSLGRVIAEAADVDCGPALRAVIERATAEDPRDRFADASEMAAALLHACPWPCSSLRRAGRKGSCTPPSRARWSRRTDGSGSRRRRGRRKCTWTGLSGG